MAEGWICLDRRIENHWIWDDPEMLRAWVYLLIAAHWEEKKVLVGSRTEIIPRGSLHVSERFLANKFKWSRGKLRNFLLELQKDHMLFLDRSTDGTTIQIINYEEYQAKVDAENNTAIHKKAHNKTTATSNPSPKTTREQVTTKQRKSSTNSFSSVDALRTPLVQYGKFIFRTTESEYQELIEEFGEPLLTQELPHMDRWIAKAETPAAAKYRKPNHNHYLFACNWLKKETLSAKTGAKRPTTPAERNLERYYEKYGRPE